MGTVAVPDRDGTRHARDGSRTCFESRIAIPSAEEPEEFPTPTRRFTVWETTSGLPDDCREEDDRAEARHFRDLRGRVKRARTVVAGTPGLAETLAGDWRKAAGFYSRFGVTEAIFRNGVPKVEETESSPIAALACNR